MDNLTILTSVIGASAATIGVVVTKDSKVSEFRQQWIDALREDIAKLCSTSIALYRNNIRYEASKILEGVVAKDSDDLVEQTNSLMFRIQLRLDPKKQLSKDLLSAMDSLCKLCTFATEMQFVVDQQTFLVIEKAQAVLDEGWMRVRRGERRFRITFAFALSTLVGSLIVLVLHWWKNGHKF